ncbi:hypothetical protein QMG25_09680 [Arthrobacter sp. H35-D1]|nr:hypothetical protein [Arthrobacter sp. H35-D1]
MPGDPKLVAGVVHVLMKGAGHQGQASDAAEVLPVAEVLRIGWVEGVAGIAHRARWWLPYWLHIEFMDVGVGHH